jgi:hypothetical protein
VHRARSESGNLDDHFAIAPTTVQGQALGLEDPAEDIFTPAAGSVAEMAGCGIRGGRLAPGVHRLHPYHFWLGGVQPENAARAGSTYGTPADLWELSASGQAVGGSTTVAIEGLSLSVTTTPGMNGIAVAYLIAAEINANGTLASFGITAEQIGSSVRFAGAVTSLDTDDPGIELNARPLVAERLPTLAGVAAAVLILLLGATGVRSWMRRR